MVHCLTASRQQPEVVLVGDLTGAQGSWERACRADPIPAEKKTTAACCTCKTGMMTDSSEDPGSHFEKALESFT